MLEMIDVALKSVLTGFKIDGKDVPVVFASPEGEFKTTDYPCLAVQLLDVRPAPERRYQETLIVDPGPESPDLRYYVPCEPYDVYYQVMVLTTKNEHDRGLHLGIMTRLPSKSFLTIIENGVALKLDMDMKSFAQLDKSGDSRVFKKVWTYCIAAWLNQTPDQFLAVKKIKELDVQIENNDKGNGAGNGNQ